MAKCFYACVIDVHQLAAVVRNRIDNVLILDSRSFLEYNVSHIINAVNVGCAKLMKRRLQQDKLSVKDFLAHSCHWNVEPTVDIIVYDQNTEDTSQLNPDSFLFVFLQKLLPVYNSVNVLKGGFLEFQACYPNLCEDDKAKYTPLTSLSQPCLPISDHGPTRILSFLYLGSQHDALNKEVLLNHNITYELNVSTNCPKPDFIQESHFMRIPVIDNYSEKLLPYFPKAFQFLDKVREAGGCALVHCLAGISRSATVAIAYVMRHLKMSSDEAYRFVKAKRATISPNFNFLGQLLEYEKQLQRENILDCKPDIQCQQLPSPPKDVCVSEYECRVSPAYDALQAEHPASGKHSLLKVPSFHTVNNSVNSSSPGCMRSTNKSALGKQVLDVSSNVSWKQLSLKDKKIEAEEWSSKCISLSSLKELSFTPCQAAVSDSLRSTKSFARESNSWSAGDTDTQARVYTQVPSVNSLGSLHRKGNLTRFDMALFENILSECKMETFNSISTLSSSMWSPQISPSSPRMQEGEYSDKEYKRSDSTSTSGLGSEGSDLMDSWNEYHSSCERETDMDEDYVSVPTEEDEYNRSKTEFQDMYGEISLYAKFDEHEYGKDAKARVASFREHVFTDYSSLSNCSGLCNAADAKASSKSKRGMAKCITGADVRNSGTVVMKSKKSDGLYRAQSCPGMISQDTVPLESESLSQTPGFSGARRTRKSGSERASKNRNRYSCSSLDYMDYPSVPLFDSHSSESVSTLSPPHQLFRHSMIQVS